MAQVTLVALLLAAASGLANLQAANGSPAVAHGGGEVAFAAPANNASAASATASCAEPCYVVQEPRYPFPTCQSECDPAVCTRGEGLPNLECWHKSCLCHHINSTQSQSVLRM